MLEPRDGMLVKDAQHGFVSVDRRFPSTLAVKNEPFPLSWVLSKTCDDRLRHDRSFRATARPSYDHLFVVAS
jgi:hypothetical protein